MSRRVGPLQSCFGEPRIRSIAVRLHCGGSSVVGPSHRTLTAHRWASVLLAVAEFGTGFLRRRRCISEPGVAPAHPGGMPDAPGNPTPKGLHTETRAPYATPSG